MVKCPKMCFEDFEYQQEATSQLFVMLTVEMKRGTSGSLYKIVVATNFHTLSQNYNDLVLISINYLHLVFFVRLNFG